MVSPGNWSLVGCDFGRRSLIFFGGPRDERAIVNSTIIMTGNGGVPVERSTEER